MNLHPDLLKLIFQGSKSSQYYYCPICNHSLTPKPAPGGYSDLICQSSNHNFLVYETSSGSKNYEDMGSYQAINDFEYNIKFNFQTKFLSFDVYKKVGGRLRYLLGDKITPYEFISFPETIEMINTYLLFS